MNWEKPHRNFGRRPAMEGKTALSRRSPCPCSDGDSASPEASRFWRRLSTKALLPTTLALLLLATSFFFPASIFSEENYCYFKPPKEWELAQSKNLHGSVKIGFLTKSASSGFCPSLNLATEKVDIPLEAYIKAVKTIHESNRKNRWRDLGRMNTPSGPARLTEIDTHSEWGPIRLLQLISIKDGTAYILTAASLKEEFGQFHQEFKKVFQTFTITPDLMASITDAKKRAAVKQKMEEENKDWKSFQNYILKDFDDMGAYWKILFLAYAKTYFD